MLGLIQEEEPQEAPEEVEPDGQAHRRPPDRDVRTCVVHVPPLLPLRLQALARPHRRPVNHWNLPQTLVGFFYHTEGRMVAYASVVGPPFFDASLTFLPQ